MNKYSKNWNKLFETETHCHYCGCELIAPGTKRAEPYYEYKVKHIANQVIRGWYLRLQYGVFSVDHIIPESKGGTDELDNLIAACMNCNMKKGDRSYESFRSRIEKSKQDATR